LVQSNHFHLQTWSQEEFKSKQPTGRQDAVDLRAWLHNQLDHLNANTAEGASKEAMLEYAETAIDLYNTAFHELTRQVSQSASDSIVNITLWQWRGG
jgi:hypothetical protein